MSSKGEDVVAEDMPILAASLRRFLRTIIDESLVASALYDRTATTTAFANYIARRGNMLSYLPAGKEHVTNSDDTWRRENRQEGKPGKIARKLLRDPTLFTDKDYEVFANFLKAQGTAEEGNFQIVSGQDIRYWYHGRNYAKSTGVLQDSCMQYDHCQSYFDIYCENPDLINMLILINDDEELVGRALVWHTDQGTILDRIYGSDDTIQAFRDYAEEHDWWWRARNTYDREQLFVKDGESQDLYLRLPIKHCAYRSYPYMDTFKFLDLQGFIANSNQWGYDYALWGTGGTDYEDRSEEDEEEEDDEEDCTDCGNTFACDDLVDGLCYSCRAWRDSHARCRDCDEEFELDELDYAGYCVDCRPTECVNCLEEVPRYELDDEERCNNCAACDCLGCGTRLYPDALTEGRCAHCNEIENGQMELPQAA